MDDLFFRRHSSELIGIARDFGVYLELIVVWVLGRDYF